jgi:hypothetical protein
MEPRNIRIDPHAAERAKERGASEREIRDVLETGSVIPAKHGRRGRFKTYDFKQKRLGKHYEQKRVEVFYVTEGDDTVIVTVYVFYGKWE